MLRVSKLSTQDFRGLTGSLEFDFAAPLTLIYAANGTGKTSVCDAAEWLLTGQVERLRDSQHFDPDVLISKFAGEGILPNVSASLELGERRLYAARTFDGVRLIEAGKETVPTLSQFLETIAPDAAGHEAHHTTAIMLRQNWLRGVRFLSAEALSTLIDTDEGTLERRKQIFADLLGIRHFLDAAREIERYRSLVSPRVSELARSIQSYKDDEEALESAVERNNREISETEGRAIRGEMRDAAELLQLTLPKRILADRLLEYIEMLSAEHSKRAVAHKSRVETLQSLAASWPAWQSHQTSLSNNEKLKTEHLRHQKDITAKLKSTSERVAVLGRELADAETRQREMRLLSEVLSSDADQFASSVNVLPQFRGRVTRDVLAALPRSLRSDRSRREQRQNLSSALQQESAVSAERQQLHLLQRQYDEMRPKLLTQSALATLENQLRQAERALANAKRAHDEVVEPLQRLHSVGQQFIAHDHVGDNSSCPLCNYNWGTNENLREAIKTALSNAPAVVRAAAGNVELADASARAIKKRYDDAMGLRDQAGTLNRSIETIKQHVDAFDNLLATMGIRLEKADDAKVALRAHGRLIDLAQAAFKLQSEVEKRADILRLAGLADLEQFALPVHELSAHITSRFELTHKELSGRIAALRTARDREAASKADLEREYGKTQREIDACGQQIQRDLLEIEKTNQQWKRISKSVLSQESLETAKEQAASEEERLDVAGGHVVAARSLWELEQRRKELSEIRKKRAALERKRAELIERVRTADEAIETIKGDYTAKSVEQVRTLGRAVNTFFSRMHANRIVDYIDVGRDADFLHWLAGSGGHTLDPKKEFSQGQRQDWLFLFSSREPEGSAARFSWTNL